jgi:hypothetical protein
MKKSVSICISLIASSAITWLGACNNNNPKNTDKQEEAATSGAYSTTQLPQDAQPVCVVPQSTFNTWFTSGTPTTNGAVAPANSVTFGHQNNCDFYQWSHQMFLWITSVDQGQYGGAVIASPTFYTVVPDDSLGGLKLQQHVQGILPIAKSGLVKNGPNRLPMVTDKQGNLFELLVHKPGEKLIVRTQAGKSMELASVEQQGAQVLMKDKAGKQIEQPLLAANLIHPENILHAFTTTAGSRVIVNSNGIPVDGEVDQATQDALIAQNGSLVYYITMVNDMYAYFLTGVKSKALPGNQFPTTAADRSAIVAYARKNGFAIPADSNALAIELKTSWVLAESLQNTAGYFLMDAMVPTYTPVSDSVWKPGAPKMAKLALIGAHIVGSVAGHPEMVWATFEHNTNSPNASYQYINKQNEVTTVPADKGQWLLNANAGSGTDNVSYIHVEDNTNILVAKNGNTIKASNTLRVFPFGVGTIGRPNQQDTSASASNTELISINNNIISMIPGNDLRKNYLQIGATWTFGGAAPNGHSYSVDTAVGSAIGTSQLANSTMETYFQRDGKSCFTCHSGNKSLLPGKLSHVYDSIAPLSIIGRK